MTKEGKEFIENLNLYLITSGKSDKERLEFIQEAEDHLRLGEEEGKTVRDIFGDSPEEYAKSVAVEMTVDKKELVQSAGIFIFGIFVWMIFLKIENGIVSFTNIEVIFTPIIYILTLIAIIILNRRLAFKDKSLTISLFLLFTCNIGSLVAVGLISNDLPNFLTLSRGLVNIIIISCFIITLLISINIKTYILFLPFIWKLPLLMGCLFNTDFSDLEIYFNIAVIILALGFMKFEEKRMVKED